MSRAYSLDLRERVVAAVEKGGLSARRAAAQFGVGASTAIRWVGRLRRTGSVRPSKIGGSRESLPGSIAPGCCSGSQRRISPCEAWWLSSAHAA
jgi:transposase-like protein